MSVARYHLMLGGGLLVHEMDAVWWAQEGRCFYCMKTMRLHTTPQSRQATVEHVTPKVRGGAGVPWNRVWACRTCNQRRGHKPLGRVLIDRHRWVVARARRLINQLQHTQET